MTPTVKTKKQRTTDKHGRLTDAAASVLCDMTAWTPDTEPKKSSRSTGSVNVDRQQLYDDVCTGGASLLPTTSVHSITVNDVSPSQFRPLVFWKSSEDTGQAGRSRSSSPAWTDDDSLHDADFDIVAEVESEKQRRRRGGGSSSDSDGGPAVPLTPSRVPQWYRKPPPLKPGASEPAPLVRAWNAGRPRTRASQWRRSNQCPVPECGKCNTRMTRHFQRCHSDMPASEVSRYLDSARRRPGRQFPEVDSDTTETVESPRPSASASIIDVRVTVCCATLAVATYTCLAFVFVSHCVSRLLHSLPLCVCCLYRAVANAVGRSAQSAAGTFSGSMCISGDNMVSVPAARSTRRLVTPARRSM